MILSEKKRGLVIRGISCNSRKEKHRGNRRTERMIMDEKRDIPALVACKIIELVSQHQHN